MNEENKCPIWGTDCEDLGPADFDGRYVDSIRAGGKYKITGSVLRLVAQFGYLDKAKLSRWVYGQNLFGAVPMVDSFVAQQVPNWPIPSVPTRIDYLLQFVELETKGAIGAEVQISKTMLAATVAVNRDQMKYLIEQAESLGWMKVIWTMGYPPTIGGISVKGYQRLEDLRGTQPNSDQAFVAMWFDDAMNDAWENGFEPAIVDAGYKPLRIDRKEHINKIDDEIIAEIRRSRFVVADFTSEKEKPRGGVYYEAGFAHGLNIPVIYTCREDCLEDVHFDTRQFNHLTWNASDDLRKDLAKRISAVLGDGPHRKRNQY